MLDFRYRVPRSCRCAQSTNFGTSPDSDHPDVAASRQLVRMEMTQMKPHGEVCHQTDLIMNRNTQKPPGESRELRSSSRQTRLRYLSQSLSKFFFKGQLSKLQGFAGRRRQGFHQDTRTRTYKTSLCPGLSTTLLRPGFSLMTGEPQGDRVSLIRAQQSICQVPPSLRRPAICPEAHRENAAHVTITNDRRRLRLYN